MPAKQGRPKKLTDKVKEQVLQYIRDGLAQGRAATLAGLSPSTISEAKKSDPVFFEALKDAECGFEHRCLLGLLLSEKGWQRFAWLLERKFPKVWGKHHLDETNEAVAALLSQLVGGKKDDAA